MSSAPCILHANREIQMGAIFADGQCHYAFHVEVGAGEGPGVAQALKALQPAIRAGACYSTVRWRPCVRRYVQFPV